MSAVIVVIPTTAIGANRRRAALTQASQLRPNARRTREFGIGYGYCSGYASHKRYTQPWGSPRFVMG